MKLREIMTQNVEVAELTMNLQEAATQLTKNPSRRINPNEEHTL